DPSVAPDQIEALRMIVESYFKALEEEFGRLDGPREQRVQVFLTALQGIPAVAQGYLTEFRNLILQNPSPTFTSLVEEGQLAAMNLLNSYVQIIVTAWTNYPSLPPI